MIPGAVATNGVIPIAAVQGGGLRPLPPRAARIRTAHPWPDAIIVEPRPVLVFLADPALLAAAGQLRGDQRRLQADVDLAAHVHQVRWRRDHDAPSPRARHAHVPPVSDLPHGAELDFDRVAGTQTLGRSDRAGLSLGLAVDLHEVDAVVPVRHGAIVDQQLEYQTVMNERAARQAELISNFKARQAWYADGCPMFDGIANDYASSGDLARDAADDLRLAIEWIQGATTQRDEPMEVSIDRRGEGDGALKFSLSVRSLDGTTHSVLTKIDRTLVTELLVKMLPEVAQAIHSSIRHDETDAQ